MSRVFNFSAGPAAFPAAVLERAREEMRRLCSLIVEQGVITGHSGRYGQILKLRPPLVFSKQDADTAIAAIDAALERFAPC